MGVTVYQYPKCSTCRKALRWLDEHKVAYKSIDITEQPPTARVLAAAHARTDLPVRAFFNTSGESYRNGGFKDKLPTLTDAQAFTALASDGKLIKRPLLLSDDAVLVGFDLAAWQRAFAFT